MSSAVPETTQQRERLYRILVLVLVGVLIVTWASVVWLVAGKDKAEDDVADARAEIDTYAAGPDAEAAAEDVLLEMLSYDYRKLDGEYAWLDSIRNEELRARFAKRVPNLKKVIRTSKATARGAVVQSAYKTVDDDSALVLAYVRQELKDARNRQGSFEEQWATLTMVRDGDTWLIDEIDIVTVPPPS